jgi:hypothetical protein
MQPTEPILLMAMARVVLGAGFGIQSGGPTNVPAI